MLTEVVEPLFSIFQATRKMQAGVGIANATPPPAGLPKVAHVHEVISLHVPMMHAYRRHRARGARETLLSWHILAV